MIKLRDTRLGIGFASSAMSVCTKKECNRRHDNGTTIGCYRDIRHYPSDGYKFVV